HEYDIFVNASNVDNMPGAILEAFACGLPVVSTKTGGIPYILEDEVTGLLVNKYDCHAIADKAIQLLEDPELSLRLARNAREECQKYSWESVRPLLLNIL
ncbi:MAG: glycosyltransferase, partial [Candidatus Hodarchaeota archaeon]